MLTITLPASLANLEKLITQVSDWLESNGLSRPQTAKIDLALEEALVNVCRHAYRGGQGDVEVRCRILDGRDCLIEIIDSGIPFDACAYPAPELTACIADRKVGGLGVYLMRNMAEQMTYRRENEKNILTLVFRTTPQRNDGTAESRQRA
jgi:serine/threonine-protein kinase RsbW